jgi:hypothetical protein
MHSDGEIKPVDPRIVDAIGEAAAYARTGWQPPRPIEVGEGGVVALGNLAEGELEETRRGRMARAAREEPDRLPRWVGMAPELGMGYEDPYAAADTAIAFYALESWIKRNPAGRSVWTIDRPQGKWRVGLQSDGERFTASQDAELRGAIRNALTIAAYAGCP